MGDERDTFLPRYTSPLPSICDRFLSGGFMDIRAAIKREERKLEKQLARLQHQLKGVRAAAQALGKSAGRSIIKAKKRVMSAAARARISKAQKARWAKARATKKAG
jgi:hypothetical protein